MSAPALTISATPVANNLNEKLAGNSSGNQSGKSVRSWSLHSSRAAVVVPVPDSEESSVNGDVSSQFFDAGPSGGGDIPGDGDVFDNNSPSGYQREASGEGGDGGREVALAGVQAAAKRSVFSESGTGPRRRISFGRRKSNSRSRSKSGIA